MAMILAEGFNLYLKAFNILSRIGLKLAANIQYELAFGARNGIGLQLVLARLRRLDYILVDMAKQQLQALHHCVYSLQFHLVLVTKYRRRAITKEMLERLDTIFMETLQKWKS